MSLSFFEQKNILEEQKNLFEQNELFDTAIALLSEHKYSEHELREQLKLTCASFPDLDKHIDPVFERLRNEEVMNDRRLAEVVVERYLNKGNAFITEQLEKKGISNVMIQDVLANLPNEDQRALEEARYKQEAALNSDTPPITKRHLYQFLTGRKFSDTSIQKAVDSVDCLDESKVLSI